VTCTLTSVDQMSPTVEPRTVPHHHPSIPVALSHEAIICSYVHRKLMRALRLPLTIYVYGLALTSWVVIFLVQAS